MKKENRQFIILAFGFWVWAGLNRHRCGVYWKCISSFDSAMTVTCMWRSKANRVSNMESEMEIRGNFVVEMIGILCELGHG